MNDPGFIKCVESSDNGDPNNYFAVVANCYGFAGRPRYLVQVIIVIDYSPPLNRWSRWLRLVNVTNVTLAMIMMIRLIIPIVNTDLVIRTTYPDNDCVYLYYTRSL